MSEKGLGICQHLGCEMLSDQCIVARDGTIQINSIRGWKGKVFPALTQHFGPFMESVLEE